MGTPAKRASRDRRKQALFSQRNAPVCSLPYRRYGVYVPIRPNALFNISIVPTPLKSVYPLYRFLTPLELQSRFGDKELKFQVICPELSPKRDCNPKRVKSESQKDPIYWRRAAVIARGQPDEACFRSNLSHLADRQIVYRSSTYHSHVTMIQIFQGGWSVGSVWSVWSVWYVLYSSCWRVGAE